MSRNKEEMDELRQEMLQEDYEDEQYEILMRSDIDYALSQLSPDMVKDAVDLLKLTVETMGKYGHEITVDELMDTN